LRYRQLKLFLGEPVEIPEVETEEFSAWFAKAIGFLTEMRVRFLGQLRFSMRALSEGYRLLGPNAPSEVIEIINMGIKNKDPALWEDVSLSPPFDHGTAYTSSPLLQALSSSS
jgi:hypothetical protein